MQRSLAATVPVCILRLRTSPVMAIITSMRITMTMFMNGLALPPGRRSLSRIRSAG